MKTVLIVFCTVFMIGLISSNAAIYDDFNDNSLDLSKWEVETDAETTINEVGGRIELSILPAASGDEFGAGIESTLMFTGDFDIQVDFSLVSWPDDNGVRSSLEVGSDSGEVFIERSASSPLGYFPERYYMGGDGLLPGSVSTSDDSGMLRIQRLGDVITGYYFDTDAGWQVISTYRNDEVGFDAGESLSLSLHVWSHTSPPFFNPGGQPVIVAFDNVSITGTDVPPGKATLISPSGTITEDNPTYTWNAVANSTWYYLWVNDSAGNNIKKWYTANDADCDDGTGVCSVTDTTELADGSCKWWIQTWNDYGYGPWSDAMSFTVDTGTGVPPGKASLISPSGTITENNPTYTWNAVANSTWYYLWVNDSAGNKIRKWYTADDADCGDATGVCSVTDTAMLADGSCKWWIQPWNDYGYGPWSDAMLFTVDNGTYAPPEKATLISPSGKITENTPTYTWNAVANSTWYYLWVNDRKGNQIEKWYTADEVNCDNGTGRCSVTDTTELADGSCKWWIQTWNEFGYGPWSEAMSFTVDTPPCTNIAGNWRASETVTLTCCLGGDCETDTFSGTDIITIQQNECNISYDIDVSGYGSFSRKGTINGNKIQLSGVFVILQPWCKAKKNKVDINGKVKGDRINLKGSGKVTGKCDGYDFSCTGDSTSKLTRLSYSATGQAATGKEFTRESSTQLLNNCIKILTIMDH